MNQRTRTDVTACRWSSINLDESSVHRGHVSTQHPTATIAVTMNNERRRNWRGIAALLPPARDAGGMAKPIAKLVSILTPKRRWAQLSLCAVPI
jgi:hypothetical protein